MKRNERSYRGDQDVWWENRNKNGCEKQGTDYDKLEGNGSQNHKQSGRPTKCFTSKVTNRVADIKI